VELTNKLIENIDIDIDIERDYIDRIQMSQPAAAAHANPSTNTPDTNSQIKWSIQNK
jgi:hypothetical protein